MEKEQNMNEKSEMNIPLGVEINIYGGTVMIASAATTAVQNLFGGQGAEAAVMEEDVESFASLTENEHRLLAYVWDVKRLKEYVHLIGECVSAHELALMVVERMLGEEHVQKDTVVKAAFIESLLPFAVRITSGNTVDNVRQQINNALMSKTRKGREMGNL